MAAVRHQHVKVGPWGNRRSGVEWDDGVHSGVRQIRVGFDGWAIGSIQIEYDNDGSPIWSEQHGGINGNNNVQQFRLDYPREIVTSISGFYDTHIRSLTVEVNLNNEESFGRRHDRTSMTIGRRDRLQGTRGFSCPTLNANIVGCHGKSDAYLRAIGFHLSNAGVCSPGLKPWRDDSQKLIQVGPWGGRGGETWDDGSYSGLLKIRAGYDRGAIVSIHIEYDNNGSTVWKEHGGSHYDEEIELDYPREILTSISGYYDTDLTSISGYYDTYLRSLTFESNQKKVTFEAPKTDFSFPISDGKIVSFHGRSDEYLRSIGVYLSNIHAAVPPQPISAGPSGGDGGDSSHGLKLISVGPWGGDGGDKWDDVLYSGILKIRVGYERGAIVSIHIQYDNNGSTVWKEHGRGSHHDEEIELDYPQEILTSISGYYDTYLRSLTFESNLEKKVTFEAPKTDFSFPISDGKIVSFHGRSDEYLRSIGVNLSGYPQCVNLISIGPWGGHGGDMWDDGGYSGIHQIIVVYGDAIYSINIEYDNNGSPFWLEHGGSSGSEIGSSGSKIGKIRLDYPKEILTSISGHYDTYLRSLTFESNLKKYGPYGREQGTYFSIPNSDGKQIVGFHGRSGWCLDSIGVSLSNFHTAVPPKSAKPISIGPWGGEGGDMWDDGVYSGIHQIIVFYGDAIDSIHIEYDNNGSAFWLEHGGSGGSKFGKMQLDYPKEILTSISGHYDTYLRSLTFESNLKKYGPYGSEKGTYFSFPISDGKIVSFHGRSDEYLRSIGVYLSNLHAAVPPQRLKPISVGPWGGQGGDMWDDGVYSGIHRIRVDYGDAIDSIHIEYDNNGGTLWKEHGGSRGNESIEIQLDYPKEILTSISGHYDTYLRSLTFISNLKKYGPYGSEKGTYFSFPNSDGKIVGFRGWSGSYLDSIGVYLSNFHTAVPPKKKEEEDPGEGEHAIEPIVTTLFRLRTEEERMSDVE